MCKKPFHCFSNDFVFVGGIVLCLGWDELTYNLKNVFSVDILVFLYSIISFKIQRNERIKIFASYDGISEIWFVVT